MLFERKTNQPVCAHPIKLLIRHQKLKLNETQEIIFICIQRLIHEGQQNKAKAEKCSFSEPEATKYLSKQSWGIGRGDLFIL